MNSFFKGLIWTGAGATALATGNPLLPILASGISAGLASYSEEER